MTKTTVFRVIGYEIKTPEGNFMESCNFWVYAQTGTEAIKKAKEYKVDKKYYTIMEVIEKNEDVST